MSTHRIVSPRIAVIGCGYWGANLVRNFREIGALGAVCDDAEAGLARASMLAPECPLLSDPSQVWNSDVDGVVIATPAETHFRLARQALEAGKDTFVEKPLALTQREGQGLVRLAERQDRVLMVGHVLEYHPGILKLRELVASGELGQVRYIYSNRLSLGKIRREENILWSFAPHDIAIILRLMGKFPVEVLACGGSYISPNIADVTMTSLLFDDGARAHVFVSWLHPFKEQRLVVVGSRKMASFDDVAKKLILYEQRVEWSGGQPVPLRGEGSEISFSADEPLARECQAFLEAIRSRRPPLSDGLSGLAVLQVLSAAQRSLSANGQTVGLPMEIVA